MICIVCSVLLEFVLTSLISNYQINHPIIEDSNKIYDLLLSRIHLKVMALLLMWSRICDIRDAFSVVSLFLIFLIPTRCGYSILLWFIIIISFIFLLYCFLVVWSAKVINAMVTDFYRFFIHDFLYYVTCNIEYCIRLYVFGVCVCLYEMCGMWCVRVGVCARVCVYLSLIVFNY